ncbi:MAG: CRISPR-associated helicase Cas3', partial [bacterium]
TVKKAQELYKELKVFLKNKGVSVELLHSRFIKRDRSKKEEDIFKMGQLENKENGIWVTTQVVEASLDIDFDVLYTELSDVCGLCQRMGRVYRARDLINNETNIFVYVGQRNEFTSGVRNGGYSIIDSQIFNLSKEAILGYSDKELNEQEKMNKDNTVYTKENLEDSKYYKKIKEKIYETKNIKEYELRKKDVCLRHIFNQSIIPMCIYNKERKLIDEQLSLIRNSKSNTMVKQMAKDKIKSITVDIPLYEYEEACKKALICGEVQINKYDKIPVVAYDYSFENGLTKPEKAEGFRSDLQFI